MGKDLVYPDLPIAIKADFLPEDYFNELSERYEQIRSEHQKWYWFDTSKAIASHTILTHLMNDLTENQELLNGHISDQWYAFRDQKYKEIAIEFCKRNNLDYIE